MSHHPGHCPQCGQLISPTHCLEANTLRRDVWECPNCQARILECRFPGCHEYTLGGRLWDDNFCPACTKQVTQTAIAGGLVLVLGKYFGKPSLPPWIRT